MKITWITDGQGWSWDNQAREIAQRLPEHDHTFIFRKRGEHLGGNTFILEIYELFQDRLRRTRPDIIMAMHWGGIDESMLGIAVCRVYSER